jgi:hypothetical protein
VGGPAEIELVALYKVNHDTNLYRFAAPPGWTGNATAGSDESGSSGSGGSGDSNRAAQLGQHVRITAAVSGGSGVGDGAATTVSRNYTLTALLSPLPGSTLLSGTEITPGLVNGYFTNVAFFHASQPFSCHFSNSRLLLNPPIFSTEILDT